MADEKTKLTEQQYTSCLASVELLRMGQPIGMAADDWGSIEQANRAHLALMIDKHDCTDHDMTSVLQILDSESPVNVQRVVPDYDPLLQRAREAYPENVNGSWVQTWEVTDLSPEELAQAEANRIESLWQAAHKKEFDSINGSAVGMVTLGLLAGKPKCQAVQAWIQSIWNLYYERKASGSTDTDYSVCGEMPHSVPELMAEVLG